MIDQKAFFEFPVTEEDAKELPRYAVGHSWGGFTSLGALCQEYKVDKVCCISGFGKVADVMATNMPKYRLLRPLFAEMTYLHFGRLGGMNYYKLVRDTDKPVLMFHGGKDEIVHCKDHFLKCKKWRAATKTSPSSPAPAGGTIPTSPKGRGLLPQTRRRGRGDGRGERHPRDRLRFVDRVRSGISRNRPAFLRQVPRGGRILDLGCVAARRAFAALRAYIKRSTTQKNKKRKNDRNKIKKALDKPNVLCYNPFRASRNGAKKRSVTGQIDISGCGTVW